VVSTDQPGARTDAADAAGDVAWLRLFLPSRVESDIHTQGDEKPWEVKSA
jgi:hypothetical protein